nr:MFS transporter [Peribacillus frigoritolerans]
MICVGNAFNYLPNSVHWAIVTDTEPTKAGTFGGITHFIANIAAVMAPTLTGVLIASRGYKAMFIAATILAVLGVLVMSFCRPGQRKNEKKEEVSEEQVSELG